MCPVVIDSLSSKPTGEHKQDVLKREWKGHGTNGLLSDQQKGGSLVGHGQSTPPGSYGEEARNSGDSE